MFQDIIDYSIITISNVTEYFYLNPRTGIITLKAYQLGLNQFRYQFNVQASDQRSPARTDVCEVNVYVLRDQFPPQFQQEPYFTAVSENSLNNTSIYRVTAVDFDLRVCITSITY